MHEIIRRFEPIRIAPSPKVSVIVHATNDRSSIAHVIHKASKVHPETEVIVVANGSLDGTSEIAERMGARVVRCVFPIDSGVGRSIGASAAKGDILLFTEGNMVISTLQLQPFVQAVQEGIDVALNRYSGDVHKMKVRSAVLSWHVLNVLLQRSDLRGFSMMSIPHAISRRALEIIGTDSLAIPPKAQTFAIMKGLRVEAVFHVDITGSLNIPIREHVLGDHLEAIHWLLEQTGPRCNYQDLGRQLGRVKD